MSRSGKHILVAVTLSAAGVIYAVHYQQKWEKAEMHKGVIRDKERMARISIQKERDAERSTVLKELESTNRRVVGSEERSHIEHSQKRF